LSQIARGSGATLSECAFSLKKRTSLRRFFSRKDHFKASLRKNLTQACFTKQDKEAFKFNHKMLGGLSMHDPQGYPVIQLQVMGPGLAHEPKQERI
jgi:hypothetical protein